MSVYIKNIKIKNFRSIIEEYFDVAIPNGRPGSGLTVIVGPNNVGKSNISRAFNGLFNKFLYSDKTYGAAGDTSIEIEFTSQEFDKSIETYITAVKQAYYKSSVIDGSLTALRTDHEANTSKILFKKSDGTFANGSGIDAPFMAWMKFRSVTPDFSTDEATKYGSTSILGDLLGKIFKEIELEPKYAKLIDIFKELFQEESVFEMKSETVSNVVSGYMKDYYGEVGVKFIPEQPDLSQLTKNVKTVIKDSTGSSDIAEKGSGLQRALILALIQAYAASFEKSEHKKPFYLLIDEPELSLSAQGQKKLLTALRTISKDEQIFLITHSPYFVNWGDLSNGAKIGRVSHDTVSGSKVHWLQSDATYVTLIDGVIKQWQKPYLMDAAVKEILFSDKVLFLEGQDDVGILRKWISENDTSLDFDIFGYGVQGFNQFRPYLQLALDIGLTKVAAIYDNGAKESDTIAADQLCFPKYQLHQLLASDIRDKFRACGACDFCGKDIKKCKSRIQEKSGCFDEHGSAKTDSNEFHDFTEKINEIVEYMSA